MKYFITLLAIVFVGMVAHSQMNVSPVSVPTTGTEVGSVVREAQMSNLLQAIAQLNVTLNKLAVRGFLGRPITSTGDALDVNLKFPAPGTQRVTAVPALYPPSYNASTTVTAAASPTDVFGLPGNNTNTVVVTGVNMSCTQTTAGILTGTLLTRSTADTGGTSTNTTALADDPSYPAATSVPVSYTANPTIGTLVGQADNAQFGAMATATATPNDIYIWPSQPWQKPIVLHGTSQVLYINFGGTAHAGLSCSATFRWIDTTGY